MDFPGVVAIHPSAVYHIAECQRQTNERMNVEVAATMGIKSNNGTSGHVK